MLTSSCRQTTHIERLQITKDRDVTTLTQDSPLAAALLHILDFLLGLFGQLGCRERMDHPKSALDTTHKSMREKSY